ncbi:hypothetical protein HNQ80_000278 [Anaerosolibacter carboniphilus]|uniref:Permuted papain-like amidase enzyme, YaeF/YiiX, C92 family n=1 Tax=Anaerosolibacter carboniphilus TaxID=1417629 RepID=A0A841KVJ2_9FIRM|nr:hypothetical protein [Anaerosolibacter carboniphilus]MBB6214209.1 hypothetical protein [Anaerosolibacter carboniphilus]
MKHKYIYLIFTKTGTWLSSLIYTFSQTKYVHASISFDNKFTKMYSFGRTNPENPFSGGFVEENLYEGVYRKFSKCECLIYQVRVTEDQYFSLQEQVENFKKEKDKYKYNFIGLFGVLLNMPIKRKNHYFCSQFVSELLMNSNIFNYEKVPELISSNELLAIENKEIIYEGFINQCYRVPGLKGMANVVMEF